MYMTAGRNTNTMHDFLKNQKKYKTIFSLLFVAPTPRFVAAYRQKEKKRENKKKKEVKKNGKRKVHARVVFVSEL